MAAAGTPHEITVCAKKMARSWTSLLSSHAGSVGRGGSAGSAQPSDADATAGKESAEGMESAAARALARGPGLAGGSCSPLAVASSTNVVVAAPRMGIFGAASWRFPLPRSGETDLPCTPDQTRLIHTTNNTL
eukprot:936756-Prymnesium_polylepis.2